MKKLLLILAVCACTKLYAQENSDYIITLASDTIYGEILNEDWASLSKKITFYDQESNEYKYTPDDIKGYNIQGYTFEPINYSGFNLLIMSSLPKRHFMLKLVDGKAKLYAHFPLTTGSSPNDGEEQLHQIFDLDEDNFYLVYDHEASVRIYNEEVIDYERQVLFTDWPDILSEIPNNSNYPIIDMVKLYNSAPEKRYDFSEINNQTDSVDIYIFRDFRNEDDPVDLKLKIGKQRLPDIGKKEYLHVSLPDTWSYYLDIKGKRVKGYLEFFARKDSPILLEIDAYIFGEPHIRVITPEEALEYYLPEATEIRIKD
ncbi:hypothetical protein [Roseivirga pacifica]